MESLQNDGCKLPQMVMCGDHPSVTKTDPGKDEKDKPKEKLPMSYARISPTSSGTERALRVCARSESEQGVRRRADPRRRVLSADVVPRAELEQPAAGPDRSLVQAALGSFRWPPYLLCVWVLVLLLTHALHALVAVLEHAIPPLKRWCQYCRSWTEQSWRRSAGARAQPLALAALAGGLHLLYFALYALYCVCLWAIEPLCSDIDEEPKVTDYTDEVDNKTNFSVKPTV